MTIGKKRNKNAGKILDYKERANKMQQEFQK